MHQDQFYTGFVPYYYCICIGNLLYLGYLAVKYWLRHCPIYMWMVMWCNCLQVLH